MTFEDWYKLMLDAGSCSEQDYDLLKVCWNKTIDVASAKVRQLMDYGVLYPEDALSDLKTTP